MRVNRFFVNKPLGEETFTIDDPGRTHQIKNVLRLKERDSVVFFDGKNFIDYEYTIEEIQKDKILFTLTQKILKHISQVSSEEALVETVVYLSLIKKELFELAVLKATELGVSHIVPLLSERTSKHFLQKERLLTIMKEGAEQSGRNTLPLLHDPIHLKDIVSSLSSFSVISKNTFVLSLLGSPAVSYIKQSEKGDTLAFLVGPEGGWGEEEEIFFKESSFRLISVSPLTLRAETAAIICTYLSSLFRK